MLVSGLGYVFQLVFTFESAVKICAMVRIHIRSHVRSTPPMSLRYCLP